MSILEQIINLKNGKIDKSERGYLFESLIREIQPWDRRPPIVMSPQSEQLDGVFEYKGNLFIIESKAVDKILTPGSKEWEDFELKIRKRQGHGIIGLFCSLNDVSDELVKTANSLNKEGFSNILIYGNNWEQLYNANFEFCHFLEFMILNARIKRIASVNNLTKVKKWYFDKENISNHFTSICEKHSSIFIRRFKHEKHEQIFVSRKISKSINAHIENFKPSILKRTKNDSLSQLVILRDLSGSGKTTTAIDYILNNNISFCFGYSANQIELDVFFENFISKIEYSDFGLRELAALDKPLVFIIDSLDEVKKSELHQKRKEIYALIRRVEELNKIAITQKLIKFPVLLLFTVRDDYWHDWDESFDGREVYDLKNRLTIFTENELKEAIDKYSKAYHFKIDNVLSQESINILSTPINLEIFSLANSFNGNITIDSIWEGELLSKFFKRKFENIQSKHYIENFKEVTYIKILIKTANRLIFKKELSFDVVDIISIINDYFDHLKAFSEDIIKLLTSEQILISNPKFQNKLQFKYTRFVEYLIALDIIENIKSGYDLNSIDSYIQSIYTSHILNTHTVLKNIRTICRQSEYYEIGQEIMDYYQTSETYLNNFLPKLRCDISLGIKTQEQEIKQLISKTYSQNPKINWDIFFIICAKKNNQTKEHILSAFISAWEANSDEKYKVRRWRLIDKLASLTKLIINETVLNILFKDSIYKDWEVYLGKILEFSPDLRDEFFDLWNQIDGSSLLLVLMSRKPNDWIYVKRLLIIVLENKSYIIGDFLDESISQTEYITFEKKRQYKFESDKKKKIDDYINNLLMLLSRDSETYQKNRYFNVSPLHISSTEEKNYLNEEFEEKIEKYINRNNQPFLNVLIANIDLYYELIMAIISNKSLDISFELPSEYVKATPIMALANSNIGENSAYDILDFIYSRGYQKNDVDTVFFSESKNKISSIYYIIKSYYLINDRKVADTIKGNERILYTLFSLRNNSVVGFGFPQLISVANNAIQHYRSFSEIIIHAMKVYKHFDIFMQKDSFRKKINNLIDIEQDNSLDVALQRIFPELF